MGATDTIDAATIALTTIGTPSGGLADALLARTSGRGVDHVIEATGSPSVIHNSVRMLARGGTLTLVGAAPRPAELHLHPRDFMSRQLRVHGCIFGEVEPQRDLATFAEWYRQGRLPLDDLLSDTIELADVPGLFDPDRVADRGEPAIRTIVRLEET
jgi:Zn-dependent alcohol dehydrogenase